MFEEQPIHPIQILIDELKNEEIEVRLNAVRSLPEIAEALGPERTRTELVPFLSITISDSEDGVLVALAEQLGSFGEFVGGKEYLPSLLDPLEQLAVAEDSVVREQAMIALESTCKDIPPEGITEHLLPIIQRLGNGEWFTPRLAATIMIPFAAPKLSDQNLIDTLTLFAKLCDDNTPMVRREAQTQIAKLASLTPKEPFLKLISPKFVSLSKDSQDSVRLLTVPNAIEIAKILNEEENIAHNILDTLLGCAADDAWRVRFMVADRLTEICEAFGPQITEKHFVTAFTKLVGDVEPEVRTAASGNVVAVCSRVSSELAMSEVIPSIKDLVVDPSEHVRVALSKVIMDLAPICGKENTKAHLVDLFLRLLQDEFSDVRLNIISKLSAVDNVISVDLLEQALIPAIVHLAEDRQWRVRLAIIEHIPIMAKQLGVAYFDEKLSALCFSLLNDPVFNVRTAATVNLRRLASLFGDDWVKGTLLPQIGVLKENSNYLYRMTTLFSIKELATVVSPQILEESLLPFVFELAGDRVPNIRLNAVKTMEVVHSNVSDGAKGKIVEQVGVLKGDVDGDVKAHAIGCKFGAA
uniref:Phosphatase PP2A regulatory subunit A/Splicing factor 3B subunit 1-like HEAT repeat domain-containing protein n=1 Tax=Paramoeba aestuarina TaxID=180227 RepID=A0A7S4NLT5_9EUKA|mmetsp:Transcript_19607/g.30723  ORF Transcript_19607/g.30723 Transcript_19607/m.30723 type:complete len:582 (+) Transcript_19607:185-1930(+)|eukprot:CAMPEP_0201522646 /NCGR_PEP_ID=MMETSP0161_2-20130828/18469_1 /ASSEMBLY_ACC=CAM_ASM_000251 /TAXON_ID=180227 /ORGANISM="Neoparamoeba aestuarina, Strain SoJaBio B1-5/56/2" /LENGTH=581 /DNA_ID=CAMNT_0047921557 /DNA_START=159 /DNA_END=1904 /DNA_ORIENTATION=+